MGDLALNIAASGLAAQQTAMETVSENLSNANTPGYVRETPNMVTTPGGNMLGVGDGVRVLGVTQPNDVLLATNAQQAEGALYQSTSLQQVLQGVQAAFPEPNGPGISADLSAFWQSWDSIAQNPSAAAPRTGMLDMAENLATDFNQASAQLTNQQGSAVSQLTSTVQEANTQLADVASLNGQITATEGAGSPANSLIDQRNNLVDQLAQEIGAIAQPMSDNTVTLRVGGISLVQGTWSDTLQVQGNLGNTQVIAQTSDAALPASGGTIAGILAALNQYLPQYQSELDGAANALITTVNNQLSSGYTSNGVPGGAVVEPPSETSYGLASLAAGGGLALGNHSVTISQAPAAASTSGTFDLDNVSSSTPVVVTAGTNDTLDVTVNGTPYALTIAPGTYTSGSDLLSAVQAAIANSSPAGASSALQAGLNGSGNLVFATVDQGSSQSLQVSGGDGLATLGLSVMGSPATGTDAVVSVDGHSTTLSTVAPGGTYSLTSGTGGALDVTIAGSSSQTYVSSPLMATGSFSADVPGSFFQGANATTITVNQAYIDDPNLVAASATGNLPDATNNGGNAQAVADMYDSPTGPDQAYRSLVQGMGSQVQSTDNQVQAQSAVAQSAQQNLQSITGVDTNDEMVKMLNYQQAFQASAKLISTVDSMMQALLSVI